MGDFGQWGFRRASVSSAVRDRRRCDLIAAVMLDDPLENRLNQHLYPAKNHTRGKPLAVITSIRIPVGSSPCGSAQVGDDGSWFASGYGQGIQGSCAQCAGIGGSGRATV